MINAVYACTRIPTITLYYSKWDATFKRVVYKLFFWQNTKLLVQKHQLEVKQTDIWQWYSWMYTLQEYVRKAMVTRDTPRVNNPMYARCGLASHIGSPAIVAGTSFQRICGAPAKPLAGLLPESQDLSVSTNRSLDSGCKEQQVHKRVGEKIMSLDA